MSEFTSVINLSTLDGVIGFRLDGVADYDLSGSSVASAGDINGDGFADLVIGAHGVDSSGHSDAGSSYVVFGQASGFASALDLSSLNGGNGFRLDGIAGSDYSGFSVASAGDVNGDGYDDIIIGAYGADPGGHSSAGSSYVVFGQASGFASALDLSSLNGGNGFRLDGIATYDFSGFSVASAGDINGDGYDDIIIGAYHADPGGRSSAGSSYVVFGQASGFASALDLSSLNGVNGFRLDGRAAGDVSGFSVASAGDVNGDGFDDLIIGAYISRASGQTASGSSYVVFGKASGFASALNLSKLNGVNGFRIDGVAAIDYSGFSVASAGDVNGDGIADLVIGAKGADPGGHDSAGSSFVVFGQASGFASALNLSSLNGVNGFRIDGVASYDVSGVSVASAGDINGDGFNDLVIGAYHADPGGNSYAGSSYVVFGRASGFASVLDLSSLNGANGFRLDGVVAYDYSGHSVASAGDINGDGFADLIIGAKGAAPGGHPYAGSSYVLFGRAPDAAVNRTGAAGSQYINGWAFADTISGLGGNDRLEGRGGADGLDGGDGVDLASYKHAGGAVTVDLATPANNLGDAAGDTYTSIERFLLTSFGDHFAGDNSGDFVHGADGNDILTGGSGTDRFDGDAGDDNLKGGGGADSLSGEIGADIILGEDGNDVIVGGAGADSISGGNDVDTASYADAESAVAVDLVTPANNTGDATGDGYVSIERFVLSGFADSFAGDDANNWASGLAGNDTLAGSDGEDILTGGAGADSLDGGLGIDTASYDTAKTGVTAKLANPAGNTGDAAGDSYTGIENLDGSKFGDRLNGDAGVNRLSGGNGDDALRDGTGNDLLLGGSGADTLAGGLDRDDMTGGADGDVFDFNNISDSSASRAAADLIRDFAEGVDKIDINTIDASATGGGNQAFTFLSGAGDAFTAEGQVRWYQFNGYTYVELNTAGSTGAELTIRLSGLHVLTAGDLVL